jgi:hypothetical protein
MLEVGSSLKKLVCDIYVDQIKITEFFKYFSI